MFVAGSARPGAIVRIYAGDVLLGEAKADEAGRFVVDGRIALPVGRHVIRADMMGPDGVRVEFRAAVPFDRPEGEQVAAVAQPASASAPAGAIAALDGGAFDALRTDVTRAFTLLKGLFAGGATPAVDALAAARSGTEIALSSLAAFKPADTLDARMKALAATSSSAAAQALAILKDVPKDAASVAAALGKIETAIAAALNPQSGTETAAAPASGTDVGAAPVSTPVETTTPADGTAEADATAPAGGTTPADATAQTPAASTAAGEPATTTEQSAAATASEPAVVEQAPLTQSKSSVIIRRGDTLWQISRRVYGAGVRYTTIYLANQEQIQDPDRIVPGQIFGVPDKAMPDAESQELHRKRLSDTQ